MWVGKVSYHDRVGYLPLWIQKFDLDAYLKTGYVLDYHSKYNYSITSHCDIK